MNRRIGERTERGSIWMCGLRFSGFMVMERVKRFCNLEKEIRIENGIICKTFKHIKPEVKISPKT
jgi:hypothetical protein